MDEQILEQKILRAVARRPHTPQQLQNNLQVPSTQLRTALNHLVAAGKLAREGGQYVQGVNESAGAVKKTEDPQKADEKLLACKLSKLTPRFGFAQPDDASPERFIPGSLLCGAMPGDGVLVRDLPTGQGEKPVGEVVRLTSLQNRFSGTVRYDPDGRLAVEPDGCRDVWIALKPGMTAGAQPGDKVGVELVERGQRHADHRAAVRKRWGSADSAAHCAQALLYGRGFSTTFSATVLEQAASIPAKIDESDLKGRVDLRSIPVFTIDSADTKDIDDAISILPLKEGGWELGVHIADVSHYVLPKTPLDTEALARATSVYYADRVLPMLPAELSNGICSLNEGEDRLAFTCLMHIDEQGSLGRYHFAKSVVRSRVKGIYSEVNHLLEGGEDPALEQKYAAVSDQFPMLRALYEKRLALNRAQGNIEMDSAECELVLDEKGRCVDLVKQPRGLAQRIVEVCMLLANQCAGAIGRANRIPFVYRVHEPPDAEKQKLLQGMLGSLGLNVHFSGPVPTQRELADLLDRVRGDPREGAVTAAILRSMPRAYYSPQPLGHYGLALRDYAHFTSPIRRYPDLAVHRILTDLLHGVRTERLVDDYAEFAAHAAAQSTQREGVAGQLERDAQALYKAEYAHSRLGEEYEGTISGVTPHGVYVQLENTLEGFVSAAQLCKGEAEVLDSVMLYDPLTGKTWRLGDTMKVRIDAADIALGRVDFERV